jgi:hypothetical protein
VRACTRRLTCPLLPNANIVHGLALVVLGPSPSPSPKPQGVEVLDLEGPGPPRGGHRGSAVTHWGLGCWRWNGANIIRYHHFRGTPGPPQGSRSRFLARRAFWRAGLGGAGAGGYFFPAERAGVWGRANKTSLWVCVSRGCSRLGQKLIAQRCKEAAAAACFGAPANG